MCTKKSLSVFNWSMKCLKELLAVLHEDSGKALGWHMFNDNRNKVI